MPYISTEALVGGALLVVLALSYQYMPKSTETLSQAGAGTSSKKKNKKRTKTDVNVKDSPSPAPGVVQGGEKGKRLNGAGRKREIEQVKEDEKEEVEEESPKSFAAAAAAKSAKPKTLAERIAPKARKTKVDDMLATEDRPATHARVMKIVPTTKVTNSLPESSIHTSAKPPVPTPSMEKLSKFEDDYAESSEDETSGVKTATVSTSGTGTGIEEDDGWDVVPLKKKKPISIATSSSPTVAAQSTALPLGVSTKLQRKNQAKSAAKKASKEIEEADRLKRLAQHRKDLERERINEIYSNNKKAGPSKGKVLSGGSTATVTSNGKLVWD